MDKYSITLSDGGWTYAPRSEKDTSPWSLGVGFRYASPPCRTPADFRACADVVERWEADHAPKMRRRVARVGNRKWIVQGECVFSFPSSLSDDDVRKGVGYTTAVGISEIPALADLAARPDEEYTDDE